MTVKYRPHRGLLADAMAEAKEFSTIDEMLDYIYIDHKNKYGELFSRDDIIINDPIGDDDRIGWKNVRHICVKRYGNEVYDIPQCIGMCSY